VKEVLDCDLALEISARTLYQEAATYCHTMLSNPFTRTSRKNPISASCARPSASFASVLFVAISSGGHRCRSPATLRCAGNDRTIPTAVRLEYHAFHGWRPLADELGDNAGIGCALAAPDPFPCSADRDCRLFHRHVETNIFVHGCSPFDAWARRPVVSPYFHPIGEQPLILRGDSLPRLPHVDGSSTGTRVPRSGRRLKAPMILRSSLCSQFRQSV